MSADVCGPDDLHIVLLTGLHEFRKLCQLQQEGSDQLATYADILYTQALLIEGMPVEDPVAYANAVCSLIS